MLTCVVSIRVRECIMLMNILTKVTFKEEEEEEPSQGFSSNGLNKAGVNTPYDSYPNMLVCACLFVCVP